MSKIRTSFYILVFLFWLQLIPISELGAWGFFGHRRINRMAVFLLPPEMFPFFKSNIRFITENAVNPDRRRYAVDGEAPRHFIDIDVYGDSAVFKMPRRWEDAVARYSEDTLLKYGIVPWHIHKMKYRLTEAFRNRNTSQILLLASDLGHYIGDGNVPLHTTENYNGQMTGQYGIHGFWESRLPELFSDDYDFFFEKGAEYENKPLDRAWENITAAHLALDSVLGFEKELTEKMGDDRKFNFETRGGITVKVYSKAFSTAYHRMLSGQVERRMRASVKTVADFWFTCWVDAGQPDLHGLIKNISNDELQKLLDEQKKHKEQKIKSRSHESFYRLPSVPFPEGRSSPAVPPKKQRSKSFLIPRTHRMYLQASLWV